MRERLLGQPQESMAMDTMERDGLIDNRQSAELNQVGTVVKVGAKMLVHEHQKRTNLRENHRFKILPNLLYSHSIRNSSFHVTCKLFIQYLNSC